MSKKRYQVIHGQRDELYLEGRKALFEFAFTGDQEHLVKLSNIDKCLARRAELRLVSGTRCQKQMSEP